MEAEEVDYAVSPGASTYAGFLPGAKIHHVEA